MLINFIEGNMSEVIISVATLAFAIYQFFNIRILKKKEKRLLLHSRFFYLEALLSTSIARLEGMLMHESQNPKLNLGQLARAYRLDNSVLGVVSEIAELSYECFDRIDRKSGKNIQDFLGCVSETYHMLNGFYGAIENGSITCLEECREDIIKMSFKMKDKFNIYRNEMYMHCAVKQGVTRAAI